MLFTFLLTAKRYLVSTLAEYLGSLSADSITTLAAQGGAMTPAEVESFERLEHWEAMVALRVADDLAKVPGAVTRPLAHWVDAIHSIAATR